MAEVSDVLTALQKVSQASTVARFDTELVRRAWEDRQRRQRTSGRAEVEEYDPFRYASIKQLWTDHIIVSGEDRAFLRIPFTVQAPGREVSDVEFGAGVSVTEVYVAKLAARLEASRDIVMALATVRTQEGANRYHLPIGAQIGGGSSSARGAAAVNQGRTAPSQQAQSTAHGKPGAVFGTINDKKKLSAALAQIGRLSGNRQGQAAAEIVLAAQALGLTATVPMPVKRLYRAYLAQQKLVQQARQQQSKQQVKKQGSQ